MITARSFPKSHRLSGRGVFLPIREKGSRVKSGPFAAWAVASEQKFSRLGISVGRMVGNAATRNRIKRHLREAFRHAPPSKSLDLVVQVRKHDAAESSQYREWWQALLNHVEQRS